MTVAIQYDEHEAHQLKKKKKSSSTDKIFTAIYGNYVKVSLPVCLDFVWFIVTIVAMTKGVWCDAGAEYARATAALRCVYGQSDDYHGSHMITCARRKNALMRSRTDFRRL